jgi:bacterioferritin
MVHSEMCANWQYEKLHKAVEKRAIDEMKHAEKLIARIIFLEGKPVVNKLNPMSIGATVEEQLKNDRAAEDGAIKAYNEGIRMCLEVGDNGTRELIDANLVDEEGHIDWMEAQLDQIAQMGLQNYLQAQTED